jgi:hypothetical protein
MPSKPYSFFSLPWSWPVTQDLLDHWFSPTFNFAGNAPLEKEVVENIASYGRQLGWLNEVVLALAQHEPVPDDTVKQIRKTARRIEALKKSKADSALEDAEDALARLKKEAPERYQALIIEILGTHSAPAEAASRISSRASHAHSGTAG